MNRTTTNLPVCSRAILWCTHPNAKCIIARQLPIYFLKLHQTEPTGPGEIWNYQNILLNFIQFVLQWLPLECKNRDRYTSEVYNQTDVFELICED